MMTRSLITALAAVAISTPALVAPAMFTPAAAQVDLNLSIGVPPPAPMYEPVPVARPGYVWAPGFWRWDGGRHVWAPGYWMAARPGYHWTADRWAHEGGGWRHVPGHWDHGPEEHGFNHWH
jgi:WXXGXW repeat (2 copies)